MSLRLPALLILKANQRSLSTRRNRESNRLEKREFNICSSHTEKQVKDDSDLKQSFPETSVSESIPQSEYGDDVLSDTIEDDGGDEGIHPQSPPPLEKQLDH